MARIREALAPSGPPPKLPDQETVNAALPSVKPDIASMREEFINQSNQLRTEVRVCSDFSEASGALREIAVEGGWGRVALHRGPSVSRLSDAFSCPVMWTDKDYEKSELEKCDAGVTECDALVASTGSILITSRSCGGRALSVLPPHHVVVADAGKLIPDLSTAFVNLKKTYGADMPGFISFITGPSRTGDIERILVLGAHGPRRLTVLLIEDSL